MTQENIHAIILEKLREIERAHNITILHAAESGSRAWGFASTDSDYDVRFIYKHDIHEYLRLNRNNDVITMPINDEWDLSGWDLDKTLRLLCKSNPSLYEWLSSPICYLRTNFADKIKPLLTEYFSVERMIYHYLNMARNNIRIYLLGEKIKPKKYFYMIRPILACFWVFEFKTNPPVPFAELVDKILPSELKPKIDDLLAIKINNPEKTEIEHIQELDDFLTESAEKIHEDLQKLPEEKGRSWDELNKFFASEIISA